MKDGSSLTDSDDDAGDSMSVIPPTTLPSRVSICLTTSSSLSSASDDIIINGTTPLEEDGGFLVVGGGASDMKEPS
jgi:hypothetical protein